MKTKFGLFYRGHRCEMCKQLFCTRCHTKMRIPIEHFSTTPVFALSPNESHSNRIELEPSTSIANSRKISLPVGLALNSSVGSAPSSPKNSSPRASQDQLNNVDNNYPQSFLPTISGMMENGPTSMPPFMLNNKYATLPTKYVNNVTHSSTIYFTYDKFQD